MMKARAIVTFGLTAGGLLAAAVASPEADQADEPLRPVRAGTYVGVSGCSNGICHGAVEPLEGTAVLQNEYPTWMSGPHRRAYQVLFDELSVKIAAALDPDTAAHEMKLCLACHALDPPPERNEDVFVEDGVSCEACHGPAGGWRDRHFDEEWSYRQSLEAGMVDLRDPAVRGEVCLGCHLGGEAATVDHRLIAAGHPRLYFELDNATGTLPRHWRLDAERPGRRASHGVRAWAVGQAVGVREDLEHLARQVSGDTGWPDFALYNCQSCHHSLAGAAWREQPGYRFRDGRPRFTAARYRALRPLIAEFRPGDLAEYDAAAEELTRRLEDLRDWRELGEDLGEWTSRLDGLAAELETVRWSRAAVCSVMGRLAAEREALAVDVASAEQAAFAFQSLLSRLVELGAKLDDPLIAQVDALFGVLEDADAFDRGAFVERLEEMADALGSCGG